ncbi:MAG: cytochrome c oxidase subunit II [Pseudomonadota bacterium]
MRQKALTMLWAALVGLSPAAHAENGPKPWETGFQPAVTPVAEQIHSFHHMLLIIITVIAAFVLLLLLIVILRFNARANPVPSKTSHNTLIEVIWTVVPVMILVTIAIPSFKLIYYADRTPDAEMTIKAIGHQWYWSYEYPDNGNFTFDSLLVDDKDLKPGEPRLLTADNPLVIPVNTKIRLLITASDVIHSFAVPAFGVKLDGTPGRVSETWTEVTQEGTYYGQCSELCGTGHAFMPITVQVVSKEKFAAWVAEAQKKFAQADAPAIDVAAAAPPPAAN